MLDTGALERADIVRFRYSPLTVTGESSSEDRSDAALLRRIAGGDETAFKSFYSRYSGRVLKMLRQMCGERALAEDLLQEAFLAVWRKASTYRPDRGAPAGWLFAITRNKVLDHRRRKKAPTVDIDAETSSQVPAPSRPRDLRLSLEQALTRLKAVESEALRLAYFGGLTYQESAQQLEVPLGTLKSRIRTGLRKLQGELKGA